ncbi:hypothetical protein SJAG_06204 [Schizosaccharomyces japonicus yFS275]|uniref:Uncharacterized protein n=1 Tax=Schizosaccharomyces japonicus (strain yFS275 / FY16936) TaxID=402676 RepID=T0T6F3_SCHJY|nr:hypothetical protein SJAG_06204 [Schizosaccharomyces japonicus yFS275]EQC53014.1 hypothetical protein SJAG_06204 [Schizosaccharomyces japonicus yFS275]
MLNGEEWPSVLNSESQCHYQPFLQNAMDFNTISLYAPVYIMRLGVRIVRDLLTLYIRRQSNCIQNVAKTLHLHI